MKYIYKEVDRCSICPYLVLNSSGYYWHCELNGEFIDNSFSKGNIPDKCPLPDINNKDK